MIRVLHICTALQTGGAEVLLLRVLRAIDRTRFESRVISLRDRGPIGAEIADLGIPVTGLEMSPSIPNPLAFARLVRIIREYRPDVIQTWLYHADLIGLLASRIAGHGALCWGVHACDIDLGECSFATRMTVRTLVKLSRFPETVVVASRAARRWHEKLGYRPAGWEYIPVGVDLQQFRPDFNARRWLLDEMGLAHDVKLVGLIARFHPMKDHQTFLRAMAHLLRSVPDAHAVMAGGAITTDNRSLADLINQLGLQEHISLLGERTDVNRMLSGLDILCSSSYTESCPSVVCEAMACGIPCVVTDVGDSAFIVDDTGRVVPPKDPAALATACAELLLASEEYRARLGNAARRRIRSNFSIESVVSAYEALYDRLAGGASQNAARVSMAPGAAANA